MKRQSVTFKQWTKSNHSELITCTESILNFVELLCEQINSVTTHSFIEKSQAKYLARLKDNLNDDKIIVLCYLSVQDEIQGFHWNASQRSFHPVVLYYKQGGELLSHSICYISDDLTHDVDFVVSETVTFVKNFLLNNISQVFYFTDGCTGQCKNRNNFLNLCHHLEDFQIKAKRCFFATSHGKSPCDGIGGTLKRLAARVSLQRTKTEQILTPLDTFCQNEVVGITCKYVSPFTEY